MARIVTAPELWGHDFSEQSVFLAGAIDMGAAIDWQAWVIEQLRDVPNTVLMNPRRVSFTPDTLDEQVMWELGALDDADHIIMWLPKESKAPISLFEAGLYWQSSKLIIGAEEGFYRRRNLELTGMRYGVHIHSDLQMMVNLLRAAIGLI